MSIRTNPARAPQNELAVSMFQVSTNGGAPQPADLARKATIMTKHTSAFASFPEAVQAFWKFNEPPANPALGNYSAWLKDCGRLQDESLRFLGARVSSQFQAAAALAACKTPAEALGLQMQYANATVSDYMIEGKKMVELCRSIAAPGASTQP